MLGPVSVETDETVATLRMDDGKANAIGRDMIEAINAGLDRAEEKNLAVLLLGRPGRFSAGFDLSVMSEGPAHARALVKDGARLSLRLARHPAPVVAACTGHALAMGAALLLSVDLRLGAHGNFKLGFNEVAIGMIPPLFLAEQARERLSKRHFLRATVHSEIYGPEAAMDAGLLDRVVADADLFDVARAETERLAQLPRRQFVRARARARGANLDRIEATLEEDLAEIFSSS